MDRIDAVSLVGLAGVAVAATALDPIALAATLGGFVLSFSLWRLWGGRPWEALGWLAWLVAAVVLVVAPGGDPAALGAVVVAIAVGLGLLVGGRIGLFPSVGRVDREGY